MEAWKVINNRYVAACLSVFGIKIRIEKMLDERSGTRRLDLHHSPSDESGTQLTVQLKKFADDPEMRSSDPSHPMCACLLSMLNRKAVRALSQKGVRCRLVGAEGSHFTCYETSNEALPGTAGHPALLRTADEAMVAALGILNVPVLAVDQGPKGPRYLLPAQVTHKGKPVDAGATMKALREGTIDAEAPVAYAYKAQQNLDRLWAAISQEEELVLIRKPRSLKAAYVSPGSSNHALDKMWKFFRS